MAYHSGNNKRGKIHYASVEHGNESNPYDEWFDTLCGLEYYESPVTNEKQLVTCKKCLNKLNKTP